MAALGVGRREIRAGAESRAPTRGARGGQKYREQVRYLMSCNKTGGFFLVIMSRSLPSNATSAVPSTRHLPGAGGETQDGVRGGERRADAEEPHANGPLRKAESKKARGNEWEEDGPARGREVFIDKTGRKSVYGRQGGRKRSIESVWMPRRFRKQPPP